MFYEIHEKRKPFTFKWLYFNIPKSYKNYKYHQLKAMFFLVFVLKMGNRNTFFC